jgi:phage baseplate assembly protein W
MKGYSPKLPLVLDPHDGPYRLTKNIKEVISQNLKMLILTSPGERIMEPNFGVGLYNFLFELNTQNTRSSIRARIKQQIKKYMPFIAPTKIQFGASEGMDIDKNSLSVFITYAIPSLGEIDTFLMEVD